MDSSLSRCLFTVMLYSNNDSNLLIMDGIFVGGYCQREHLLFVKATNMLTMFICERARASAPIPIVCKGYWIAKQTVYKILDKFAFALLQIEPLGCARAHTHIIVLFSSFFVLRIQYYYCVCYSRWSNLNVPLCVYFVYTHHSFTLCVLFFFWLLILIASQPASHFFLSYLEKNVCTFMRIPPTPHTIHFVVFSPLIPALHRPPVSFRFRSENSRSHQNNITAIVIK